MADRIEPQAAAATAEAGPEPLDASKVLAAKKITQALARTVSLQRLYAKRNEIVRRGLAELVEAFEAYISRFGTLRVEVASLEFRLGREPIHKDTKREDSIPHQLYKDGVREIVFMPGLAAEEVEDFVDILRGEGGEAGLAVEDIVSRLWKRDFSSIDYMAIDEISDEEAAEKDESEEEDAEARKSEGRGESSYRLHAAGASLEELIPGLQRAGADKPATSGGYKLAAGFVDLDDPVFRGTEAEGNEEGVKATTKGPGLTAKSDAEAFLDVRSVPVRELGDEARAAGLASLYQLSAAERDRFRAEMAAEGPGQLCSMVCDLVFEMLRSGEASIPEESLVQVLAPMLTSMLAEGDFGGIQSSLSRLEKTAQGGFGPGAVARNKLLAELASAQSVQAAVAALDSGARGKGRDFLAYAARLPPTCAESLLACYGTVRGKEAGALVREFLLTRARQETGLVEAILGSEHEDLVEDALGLLRAAKGPEVLPLFSKAVQHPSAAVRSRALKLLGEADGLPAGELAAGLVEDPVQEVRLLAVRILASRPVPKAEEAIRGRIGSPGFDALDLPERAALFQALAACGGDRAVPFLEEKLLRKTWFSREKLDEEKRLAALALGAVGSPAAVAALERGASSRDKAIRGTCERALTKRARSAGA